MRRLLIVLGAGLVPACALVPDWDSFNGAGPGDASDEDARVAIADALSDGADGAATDADADVAVDASAPCDPGAFCDDFERTDPLGEWDVVSTAHNGSVTISSNAHTGTGAMRSNLAADLGTRAVLAKAFPAASHVHVRYLMYFTDASTRSDAVTPIIIDYSDRHELVALVVQGTTVRVSEQETDTAFAETFFTTYGGATLKVGEWAEVTVDLALGSTAHATVKYGDQTVYDGNLMRQYGSSEFNINAGCTYATAADAGTSFDIDEVRVSWVH